MSDPLSADAAPPGQRAMRTASGLRLRVGQVVCWQIAVALGLAAIAAPAPRATALTVAALALLASTAIPLGDRWAYQWVWLWLALRRRARTRDLAGGDAPPATALLTCVDRASSISQMTVDDAGVGLVEHSGGSTAVLELGHGDQPLGVEPITLPSPAALLPAQDQARGITVQLLTQVVPAPSATLGDVSAAVSYRRLTEGRIPGRQHTWLAVQVVRTPGASRDEQRQVLRSTVGRLLRRLRQDLPAVRMLDEAGLRAAVMTGAHLDLVSAPRADEAVTGIERWDAWWTGDIPQVTFHLRHWPRRPGGPHAGAPSLDLRSALLAEDCLAVTVSLAVRRAPSAAAARRDHTADGRVAVQLTARLAAPDAPTLAAAARRFHVQLAAAGAVMDRLDGRHLYGLAGTLPLGGFLP